MASSSAHTGKAVSPGGDGRGELYFLYELSADIARRRGDAAGVQFAQQKLTESADALDPEFAFNLGSTYAVMRPRRTEDARRLLASFVRAACEERQDGRYCDQCAVARDLLSAFGPEVTARRP